MDNTAPSHQPIGVFDSGIGGLSILQALRDCFGAHGYQRIDQDVTAYFHTRWLGDGVEEKLP